MLEAPAVRLPDPDHRPPLALPSAERARAADSPARHKRKAVDADPDVDADIDARRPPAAPAAAPDPDAALPLPRTLSPWPSPTLSPAPPPFLWPRLPRPFDASARAPPPLAVSNPVPTVDD